MTALRLFEAVHGYLGVLAAAALLHPAVLLRRGARLSRAGRVSVVFTATLTILAFGSGLAIYGDYRETVKRALFRQSEVTGLLFETKEHLAWAVICFTLGASAAALLSDRGSTELRRAAAAFYLCAALLCLTVAGLGAWVTAVRAFSF